MQPLGGHEYRFRGINYIQRLLGLLSMLDKYAMLKARPRSNPRDRALSRHRVSDGHVILRRILATQISDDDTTWGKFLTPLTMVSRQVGTPAARAYGTIKLSQ